LFTTENTEITEKEFWIFSVFSVFSVLSVVKQSINPAGPYSRFNPLRLRFGCGNCQKRNLMIEGS
jgi:hypothetical protein